MYILFLQAKMPDELIAREIVINDADPSVRYKLTKRQTQEEVKFLNETIVMCFLYRVKHHFCVDHFVIAVIMICWILNRFRDVQALSSLLGKPGKT